MNAVAALKKMLLYLFLYKLILREILPFSAPNHLTETKIFKVT